MNPTTWFLLGVGIGWTAGVVTIFALAFWYDAKQRKKHDG